MEKRRIKQRSLNLIAGCDKCLYEESEGCLKVTETLSKWFDPKQARKEGRMMFPWVFNIFISWSLRNPYGVRTVLIGNMNMHELCYANEAMLLTENLNDLQPIWDRLSVAREVQIWKLMERELHLTTKMEWNCKLHTDDEQQSKTKIHERGEV